MEQQAALWNTNSPDPVALFSSKIAVISDNQIPSTLRDTVVFFRH
jgi:hypothetical protein